MSVRAKRATARAKAAPKTVAVRVLPKRTLSLDRTYLALAELELPAAEAEALIEQGVVQLASEPAPRMREPVAEVRSCPHCGASLDSPPAMTPADVEAGASWTH